VLTYHYSGFSPGAGAVVWSVAGGMETWGGRRSARLCLNVWPLLPFLREGGPVQ